jgi:hypothetical protein
MWRRMVRSHQQPNLCFYYYKKRESRINSASVAGSATGLDLSALFFLFLVPKLTVFSKRANGDGNEAKRERRDIPPAMALAVPSDMA